MTDEQGAIRSHPMFATPDQITEAVAKRFNERASEMGFGIRSSAYLPVRIDDLKEQAERGGGSGRPVSMCRHLCIYIIAQHCVQFNPYLQSYKQLTWTAIGAVFNRQDTSVGHSLKSACQMLADPLYAGIYQAALDDINAMGLELWRAKYSRVECGEQ